MSVVEKFSLTVLLNIFVFCSYEIKHYFLFSNKDNYKFFLKHIYLSRVAIKAHLKHSSQETREVLILNPTFRINSIVNDLFLRCDWNTIIFFFKNVISKNIYHRNEVKRWIHFFDKKKKNIYLFFELLPTISTSSFSKYFWKLALKHNLEHKIDAGKVNVFKRLLHCKIASKKIDFEIPNCQSAKYIAYNQEIDFDSLGDIEYTELMATLKYAISRNIKVFDDLLDFYQPTITTTLLRWLKKYGHNITPNLTYLCSIGAKEEVKRTFVDSNPEEISGALIECYKRHDYNLFDFISEECYNVNMEMIVNYCRYSSDAFEFFNERVFRHPTEHILCHSFFPEKENRVLFDYLVTEDNITIEDRDLTLDKIIECHISGFYGFNLNSDPDLLKSLLFNGSGCSESKIIECIKMCEDFNIFWNIVQ